MGNIKFPIFSTTMLVFAVNIIPVLSIAYSIIAALLFFAPFVVIWMVDKMLKDGTSSNKTFETHWYEDQVV